MKRREFLTVASGAGAATATAGAAAGGSPEAAGASPTASPTNGTATGNATTTGGGTPEIGGNVKPDFGGYLDESDGGYADLRGQDEVTVAVGAQGNQGTNAFEPAGIWISPGTVVKWEWTGDGSHNVISEEGPASLDSGDPVSTAGVNYEHTFEKEGVTTYFCRPHKSVGMKGGIAVGPDVATVTTTPSSGGAAGGGGDGGLSLEDLESMGVPFQAHFVGLATVLMLLVSLVYTFFLLKYGTSPHASGGNN